MTLRLIPEIFDSIDMISSVGEKLGMVDSHVMKVTRVESIVAPERACVNNAVPCHFSSTTDSRVSVLALGTMAVRTFPIRLSKPKTATLADAARPRFPLRVPPK
jgi:hypothetical protein